MKNLLTYIGMLGCIIFLYSRCDTVPEALDVQRPYKYDDKYYENLRAYKQSDHAVAFGWFTDYGQAHSLGIRFLGLPDSMDIVSLWGGIPDPVSNAIAYNEMRFVQEKKGTRFVYVLFPGLPDWGKKMLPAKTKADTMKIITAFGDILLKKVYDNKLDGLDMDNEINGDWMHGNNLDLLVEYLGGFIGPKGKDPSKLLIVDGYPIGRGYEYLSYFVAQAYSSSGAKDLQFRFNQVYNFGLDSKRFIVTENIGDYWKTGGVPFMEADGNTLLPDGTRLYSLEGMARWNPTQGRKGGFGAFFMQRDYNLDPPYKYMRKSIQEANPAVK